MSFIRQSANVVGGQFGAQALNMVAGVVIARSLGPGMMGQFELLRTAEVLVVTACAMGIGSSNIYFLNNRNYPVDIIVTNSLKTVLCAVVAISVLLVFAVRNAKSLFGDVPLTTSICFSVAVSGLLCASTLNPVLVAQLRTSRSAVSITLPRFILVLVGALLRLKGALTLGSAIAALAAAEVCGSLIAIAFLRQSVRLRIPFDLPLLKSVIKYGVKLAGANILQVASPSISLALLRLLAPGGFGPIGLYTRAVAVSGWIMVFSSALGPLFFAKWAAASKHGRREQSEMAIRLSTVFAVLGVIGVVLLGQPLIVALYGSAYASAGGALVLLSLSAIPMSVYTVCNNLLNAAGKAHVVVYVFVAHITALVVCSCLAVPKMGTSGAAVSVLVGNCVMACAGLAVCRSLYGLRLNRCIGIRMADVRYVSTTAAQLGIGR